MRGLDGTSVRWFIVLLLLMGIAGGAASGLHASLATDDRIVWAGRIELFGCLAAGVSAWLVLSGGFGLALCVLLPSAFVPVAIEPSLLAGVAAQVYLGALLVSVALLAMAFAAIAASGTATLSGTGIAQGGPWLGSGSVTGAFSGLLGASTLVKGLLAASALMFGTSLPGVMSAPARSDFVGFPSGFGTGHTDPFGEVQGLGGLLSALFGRAPASSGVGGKQESTIVVDDTEARPARPSRAVTPATRSSPRPVPVQSDPAAILAARRDVLHAYYRDLNSGDFHADRYFAPNVERFITMQGTTSAAIEQYIRGPFPKQFQRHHFEMDDATLASEGLDTVVYVEHSRYLLARRRSEVETWVRVRVRFDAAGKIQFFRQFEVIKRQSL